MLLGSSTPELVDESKRRRVLSSAIKAQVPTMKHARIALAGAMSIILVVILVGVPFGGVQELPEIANSPPVLSVTLTRAEISVLPLRVSSTGNVVAWQEASVGSEAGGLRLTEVKVNVGDTVKRGEVLALFNPDIVKAELAEAVAAVEQAAAEALEAEANSDRARSLERTGAMSTQQINQYVVGAKTARARLDVARAIERGKRLRLGQTRVLAPSDGIITSRSATVGAVVAAGEELFRLIQDGRLEWRAEVALADMEKLVPGQRVTINAQGHEPIRGTLRMVAPTINTETRNGLAYVDLPMGSGLPAGAFAQGYFEVCEGPALTVPQTAVLLRNGFTYVMHVGPGSKVVVKKVAVGRRIGERIEITQGLTEEEKVITSGLGFLSEGDTVNVVNDISRSEGEEHLTSRPTESSTKTPAWSSS
jgi:RND family efflux transporter MFP subunit